MDIKLSIHTPMSMNYDVNKLKKVKGSNTKKSENRFDLSNNILKLEIENATLAKKEQ